MNILKGDVMKKGKPIAKSSSPSKARIGIGFFFFIISVFAITAIIIDWMKYPLTPPTEDMSITYYLTAHVVLILALIVEMVVAPYYAWGLGFNIYENGLTVPYSNFFNWIFHKNRKEGQFIPYSEILGYIGNEDLEDAKTHEKYLRKGKDAIMIFYWDRKRRKIRMTMYGENAKDVRILKDMFKRKGVKKLPRTCPNCGKKMYGMDYLAGECLKCHYKIFEIPEDSSGGGNTKSNL